MELKQSDQSFDLGPVNAGFVVRANSLAEMEAFLSELKELVAKRNIRLIYKTISMDHIFIRRSTPQEEESE